MSIASKPPRSRFAQLRSKGRKYWLEVLFVSIFSVLAGHYINEHSPDFLRQGSMRIYQFFSELNPKTPSPGEITLVLIGDEEFWGEPFERRLPLYREELGKAVEKACSGSPAVVALDFDLRSPKTDGTLNDNAVYREETRKLVEKIRTLAENRCTIVLPATTFCPKDETQYCRQDPSIFSGQGLTDAHISWGFIGLPTDLRQIPDKVYLGDGENDYLESFALAIVRAKDPNLTANLASERRFSYGTFVPPAVYQKWNRVISYNTLMTETSDQLKARFNAANIVMIGGNWHTIAADRGELVDQHYSPVGKIAGIFLHANYIDSILRQRTAFRFDEWVNFVFDGAICLIIAVIFALDLKGSRRIGLIVVMAVVMFMLQYVLMQNAGVVFDVLIPAVVLFVHWLYDEHRSLGEKYAETLHERDKAVARRDELDAQLAECRAAQVPAEK